MSDLCHCNIYVIFISKVLQCGLGFFVCFFTIQNKSELDTNRTSPPYYNDLKVISYVIKFSGYGSINLFIWIDNFLENIIFTQSLNAIIHEKLYLIFLKWFPQVYLIKSSDLFLDIIWKLYLKSFPGSAWDTHHIYRKGHFTIYEATTRVLCIPMPYRDR